MSHIKPDGTIVFQETEETLSGVDTIIFATGYNFNFPFCKTGDQPWDTTRMLDSQIHPGERDGGEESEVGGMKGLSVERLDPLLLFLENDTARSIAFPVLRMSSSVILPRPTADQAEFQVVPFPLAETQTRLTALLWSSLLSPLSEDIQIPSNSSNPYFTPAPSPSPSPLPPKSTQVPVRKVVQMRKKLVFGPAYEFTYQEYLMHLMEGADDPEWVKQWWGTMAVKRRWRDDTGLRKRTLGY